MEFKTGMRVYVNGRIGESGPGTITAVGETWVDVTKDNGVTIHRVPKIMHRHKANGFILLEDLEWELEASEWEEREKRRKNNDIKYGIR